MKKYLIPLIISAIVIASYFSISQTTLQEQSLSKQCPIPYDVNFLERSHSAPNDGKPHYTIEEKFSIYNTIPITSLEIDEGSQSLIIKVMPYSHGYIIMCDPLPILQEKFDTKMNNLMILVDDKVTEYKIIENVLKLNINNNTKIEMTIDDYQDWDD